MQPIGEGGFTYPSRISSSPCRAYSNCTHHTHIHTRAHTHHSTLAPGSTVFTHSTPNAALVLVILQGNVFRAGGRRGDGRKQRLRAVDCTLPVPLSPCWARSSLRRTCRYNHCTRTHAQARTDHSFPPFTFHCYENHKMIPYYACLLYTSDAADD